jgi:hypothetical protein
MEETAIFDNDDSEETFLVHQLVEKFSDCSFDGPY